MVKTVSFMEPHPGDLKIEKLEALVKEYETTLKYIAYGDLLKDIAHQNQTV